MTLHFTGRRFRRARVQWSRDWFHQIGTTGAGQEWKASEPAAFWRNFAEWNPTDGEAAAQFCRRHGDPFGKLAADAPIDTGHWKNLAALLYAAARAWEPPADDGVSRLTEDRERLGLARWFMGEGAGIPLLRDVTFSQDRNTGGLVPVASSLAAFMAASAAAHLAAATPMRICAECGDYFALGRTDARFCSIRCQVAHHRRPLGTGGN